MVLVFCKWFNESKNELRSVMKNWESIQLNYFWTDWETDQVSGRWSRLPRTLEMPSPTFTAASSRSVAPLASTASRPEHPLIGTSGSSGLPTCTTWNWETREDSDFFFLQVRIRNNFLRIRFDSFQLLLKTFAIVLANMKSRQYNILTLRIQTTTILNRL